MVRPVDTLPAAMTVQDAVQFLIDPAQPHHHRSYPVVDEEGRVTGMVSRADALRWTRENWPQGATLEEMESSGPVMVGYEDELAGHLADRMARANVGRVPVLERKSGRLVGLVARRDLLSVRGRLAREEGERAKLLHLRT
jgi:CBS domain-containing protein